MKIVDAERDVQIARFSEYETSVFKDALGDLETNISEIPECELLDELERRGKELRSDLPNISDYLEEFIAHKGKKVLLVDLQDVTTNTPPTPQGYTTLNGPDLHPPDLYRGAILGIAGLYGYGFESMQDGRIHNNIIPIEEYANIVGHNSSSTYELDLHSEVASFNITPRFDASPDFLSLHFLRNERLVPTSISTYDITELDLDLVSFLSERWFTNNTSPGQGGKNNSIDIPVSILYGPTNDPWARINTNSLGLEKYTVRQVEAIHAFTDHLSQRRIELPVSAGYLALLDNRRVLHGRPAYHTDQQPRYDGTDRWQRRITTATDKARIQQFESRPRVVDMDIFRQLIGKALTDNEAKL